MERPITPTQPAATPAPAPIGLVDRLLHEMTRDQRLQARTLQAIGWKYTEIYKFFYDKNEKISYRQIYYACKTRTTPQKRSGRPPILTTNQVEELIDFISLSKINRRMAYWRVAVELGWEGVKESAIRSALRRAGYKVYNPSFFPSYFY